MKQAAPEVSLATPVQAPADPTKRAARWIRAHINVVQWALADFFMFLSSSGNSKASPSERMTTVALSRTPGSQPGDCGSNPHGNAIHCPSRLAEFGNTGCPLHQLPARRTQDARFSAGKQRFESSLGRHF